MILVDKTEQVIKTMSSEYQKLKIMNQEKQIIITKYGAERRVSSLILINIIEEVGVMSRSQQVTRIKGGDDSISTGTDAQKGHSDH